MKQFNHYGPLTIRLRVYNYEVALFKPAWAIKQYIWNFNDLLGLLLHNHFEMLRFMLV